MDGILVANQPAVVGGARKSLKTNIVADLTISLGRGLPFLNHFQVERVFPTGFISGESGKATLQETARRIRASKLGVDFQAPVSLDDEQLYWGFDLPSLSDDADLARIKEFIGQRKLEVIIIDPLYLCLNAGKQKVQAGNIYEMGPLLKNVADTCTDAGATPILVHHTRKRKGGAKHSPSAPDLDDLAYSGIQEFARQWVLLGRRQPYQSDGQHSLWLSCGGSAGFSGLWHVEVDEGLVDRNFGGRQWTVEVNAPNTAEPDPETADQRASQAESIREVLKRLPEGETLSGLRKLTKIPNERLRQIFRQMPDAEETKVTKSAGNGTREYDAFRLIPASGDGDGSGPAAASSASTAHTNGRLAQATP